MLINTGNISRKVLSKVLRSFDKNFERLHGMRNIRDIVEKYEGIFQYEIRDESLMVIISVYA